MSGRVGVGELVRGRLNRIPFIDRQFRRRRLCDFVGKIA